MWKYIGDGSRSWVTERGIVPRRDLSDEEAALWGEDSLTKSGLYRKEPEPESEVIDGSIK